MNTVIIGLAFDVIVAVLLAVTIGFCWKLQERIRILQDSRSELSALVTRFDESTERAKASILDIQNASRLITESMQTKLDKANYIADDLSYLIEKATKLSGGLEAPRRESTINTPPRSIATPPAPAAPPAVGKPARSKAEQELLDALKAVR